MFLGDGTGDRVLDDLEGALSCSMSTCNVSRTIKGSAVHACTCERAMSAQLQPPAATHACDM